jgi:hypothetical protein
LSALSEEIDLARQNEELRAANGRLQRSNAKLRDKHDGLAEATYQGVRDALVAVGRARPVSRPGRDRRKGEEAALVWFGDWQLGKRTVSYDTEVCKRRVARAVDKVISITEIQRTHHPVRRCHLVLGGDMLEGITIFKKQAWEVDSGIYAQLMATARLIADSVLTLLGYFEGVIVDEVWGNHGRIGMKGELPEEENLDRVLCRIAREMLGQQPGLTWDEPEVRWHKVISVGNYRALIFHGDQVRGGGGQLPAYGIAKRVTSWAAGVTEPFHDAYLGHYHQDMKLTLPSGGRIFMTPSTESDSEFAAQFVAAKGRPGQRLHFIDPRKGRVTGEYVLWLDDVE